MELKKLGIYIYPEIVDADAMVTYINMTRKNWSYKVFANLLELR